MTDKFINFIDQFDQDIFLRTESIEYFYINEKVEILEEDNYCVIFILKNGNKIYSETSSYDACLRLADWIDENENNSEN